MYRITAKMGANTDTDISLSWHPKIISSRINLSEASARDNVWTPEKHLNFSWFKCPESLHRLREYCDTSLKKKVNHNVEVSSDQVSSSSVPEHQHQHRDSHNFKVPFPPSHLSSYHAQKFLPRIKHLYAEKFSKLSDDCDANVDISDQTIDGDEMHAKMKRKTASHFESVKKLDSLGK